MDHLLVNDQHPAMGHLLRTTTQLLLPLPRHTSTRDIVIYQLDLLPRIITHHHPRHRMHLQPADMPLPLPTRQVVVGTTPIQLLHRVMEHHPQTPLITTPNHHPRHITPTLPTVNPQITPTTPLQQDTPNPDLQDTPNLLLHPTIPPLRGIGRMYLLLLIHDDLLPPRKASSDHLRGRVVKLGIYWLGLYVRFRFLIELMSRIRIDKDR